MNCLNYAKTQLGRCCTSVQQKCNDEFCPFRELPDDLLASLTMQNDPEGLCPILPRRDSPEQWQNSLRWWFCSAKSRMTSKQPEKCWAKVKKNRQVEADPLLQTILEAKENISVDGPKIPSDDPALPFLTSTLENMGVTKPVMKKTVPSWVKSLRFRKSWSFGAYLPTSIYPLPRTFDVFHVLTFFALGNIFQDEPRMLLWKSRANYFEMFISKTKSALTEIPKQKNVAWICRKEKKTAPCAAITDWIMLYLALFTNAGY